MVQGPSWLLLQQFRACDALPVTAVRTPCLNGNSESSALYPKQACGEKRRGPSPVPRLKDSFGSRHGRVEFDRWETGFAVRDKTVAVAFWLHSA